MKKYIHFQRMVISMVVLMGLLLVSAGSVLSAEDNLKQVTLKVDGMTCVSCPATIKAALKRLPGVVKAEVSYKEEKATVMYQDGKVTVEQMIKTIEDLGYMASIMEP